MRGARRGEASGLGFDHRLEGIAAQCPLLLQVEADLRELFRRQGLIEDAAPDLLARRLAAGETLPDRMRAKARTRALAQICRTAGPAVRRWIVGQPRADRIEFDVPVAAQYVVFAVDQAGLVPALPQTPSAPVSSP